MMRPFLRTTVVIAVALVLLTTSSIVLKYWQKYWRVQELIAEVSSAAWGSVAVDYRGPTWLVQSAMEHHLEFLIDWLKTDVTGVDVTGDNVDDAWLIQLQDYPNINSIMICGTANTDAGLPVLKKLPNLQHLSLQNLFITDEGLDQLAEFPKLEEVYLAYTKVTPAGIKRLQARRPTMRVHTGP